MSVSREQVAHVAHLARIEVTENEKDFFISQLSQIIDYIGKLKELDVSSVSPTRGELTQDNIFREDTASISGQSADILNNAPTREENYFKIPRVIE